MKRQVVVVLHGGSVVAVAHDPLRDLRDDPRSGESACRRGDGEEDEVDHRLEADRAQSHPWSTDPVRRDRCPRGDRLPTVTVSRMPLKNIVRAFALMFATVLAACSGEPPTLGTTPLHSAARSSGVVEVEVLLKAGADVNAKTASGETPLHFAAANNPSPTVLKILIKAGADPRAINNEGKTPLDVEKPEYRDILSKAMMDKPLK